MTHVFFFFLMLWVILSLLYPDSFVCGFTTPMWSQESGSTAPSDIISCCLKSSLLALSCVLEDDHINFKISAAVQNEAARQHAAVVKADTTDIAACSISVKWRAQWNHCSQEEFMRIEGENSHRGWMHLVEEAYETERGGRKDKKKKMFFFLSL